MAKGLVLELDGAMSSFGLTKVERARLYGARKRAAVDTQGRTCARAALTDDGRVLLRSGMTAQGWFDAEGRQVESADITAVDDDGHPLPLVPSTLDVAQPLAPAGAKELLDLAPTAVYLLEPLTVDAGLDGRLAAGALFRFPFNYRPDYRRETGFLLKNDAGTFAVVGVPTEAALLQPDAPPPVEDDDAGDELDFEMF
jgi:hypothetical protein